MPDYYEWFCTICERTFPHNQESQAIDHMWNQHATSDPFRMFTWKNGEIMELEEREVDHA